MAKYRFAVPILVYVTEDEYFNGVYKPGRMVVDFARDKYNSECDDIFEGVEGGFVVEKSSAVSGNSRIVVSVETNSKKKSNEEQESVRRHLEIVCLDATFEGGYFLTKGNHDFPVDIIWVRFCDYDERPVSLDHLV